MRRAVTHSITTGNLFCGFISIVMAIQGYGVLAAWLIICASLLDAFDGKIARFINGESAFGAQYDSLADLVSFGVAPGVLVYLLAFQEHGVLGVMVSFMPLAFSASRLARFNLSERGEDSDYAGLTTPLQACLIASFVIFNVSLWGDVHSHTLLAGLVVIVSLLMASRFPLPNLPRITFREPGYNLAKMIVLVGCIIGTALNPPRHVFPVLASLVLTAFIFGAVRSAHREVVDLAENDAVAPESEASVSGATDDS
jgi:CDP-diacylglycerol--serine O-phosphatidyltransferase